MNDTKQRRSYVNVPGNLYDKYNTQNPIAKRLVSEFIREFLALVDKTGAKTAFEVGCGEGKLSLELLRRGINAHGTDLEPDVVNQANAASVRAGYGDRFSVCDLYDLEARKEARADLVVCCEVLEHVPEPDEALKILVQLADPWLLVSVPREPVWSVLNLARGKYISRLGNTPGHIQRWSQRRFKSLVGQHIEIVETRAPLPWTMLLCRRS